MEDMKTSLQSAFITLKNLHQSYQLLDNLDSLIAKTGKSEEPLMQAIASKYLYNVDTNIKDDLLSIGRKNKTAIYHAMLLNLVRDTFVDAKRGKNLGPEYRYSLQLDIRLWISNIYTVLDSLTGIMKWGEFNARRAELRSEARKKLGDKADGYMEMLEDEFSLHIDVQNALKELNIDDNTLASFWKTYSPYLIKSNDPFADTILKSQYLQYVPEETRELVDEYEAVIVRSDIVTLVEKYKNSQAEDIETIFEIFSQRMAERSEEITIQEQVKELFWEVVKNEEDKIKFADITAIPYEIVAETIILQEVTDDLIDAIDAPVEAVNSTSEF